MSDENVAEKFGAKLITQTCCFNTIPVSKYQTKSGIHLVIAKVDGPLVSAHLCLATEAFDDDGLPHTLEHLIFLGSEKYPYKGLLDLLANRCQASGTNAWTGTDHTAYTLETAGAEGTLALLPVYLDHVLYPVLTEDGFITEVYHISGEGKDAGVVYSEMQGRENMGEMLISNALLKLMYKDTGYCSETGGILFNLRTSTNNEKIRSYHAEFYRPENLTVIISGQVTADEVFKAIQPIEEKILLRATQTPLPPYIRPWQSKVPPLTKKQILNIKYPTDLEDSGMIELSWLGPDITTSEGLEQIIPLNILLRYLSDTPIAPLQKLLVEIEDPYASSVYQDFSENSTVKMGFCFMDVPIDKLQNVIPIVIKEIEDTINKVVPIDIARIQIIVSKQLRECLMYVENSPHRTVAFKCIADMLYSQSNDQFGIRLNDQEKLKELSTKDEEYWRSLLEKYFTSNYAAVIASPSIDLMTQMSIDEKKRVELRIEELGAEGLKEKADRLEKAIAYNSREVPPEILHTINVADSTNISYHSIKSWSMYEDCPYFDINKMPLYTKVNNLKTNFVYMKLLLNTSCLSSEQRNYLPLLLDVIYQCPIKRDDSIIPYDVVLSEIEDLFNSFDVALGCFSESSFDPGVYHHLIVVNAECEPEKYEKVVKLLTDILLSSIFTKERLLVVAQKLINAVSTYRRQGDSICDTLNRDLKYNKQSNVHACSALRQSKFLNDLLKKLNDENSVNEVLNDLNQIRKALTASGNMWLHMSSNLEKFKLSAEPWSVLATAEKAGKGFTVDDYEIMVPVAEWQGKGTVVGVGGVESSFLIQTSPGPLFRNHPDLPALTVALTYFTQLEGPMWRILRGGGFVYSFSLFSAPEVGTINLKLYRAANVMAGYNETLKLLKGFLDDPKLDEDLFISAKSSLVFDYVKTEKTPSNLVSLSLTSYLKHVDIDYNRNFIKKIKAVTINDAIEVAKKWLPGLFDPKVTSISIVASPSKVHEVNDDFKKLGFTLDVAKSLEESILNKP